MPWGLLVAIVCLWACLAVVLTLWMALILVERSLKSITKMCVGVVRTLLGQPDPDSDQVQYEEDVGNTTGVFETLPGWQYWGQSADEAAAGAIPDLPMLPEDPEGPHLGGTK